MSKETSKYRVKIIVGNGVSNVSIVREKGNTYNINNKKDPEGIVSPEYEDKKPPKRGTILRKLGIWKESGKNLTPSKGQK